MKKIIFYSMLSFFLYTNNINSTELTEVDSSNFPVIENKYKTASYMVPLNKKDTDATDMHFSARASLFSLLDISSVQALDHPSLISSCEGAIDCILLTIPAGVLEDRAHPFNGKYFQAYQSMVTQMPNVKKFYIMLNNLSQAISDDIFSEWGIKDRSIVTFVPNNMEFTMWAEDAYCVCNDLQDNETYLVEPASFTRYDDYLIADKLEEAGHFFNKVIPLILQGGNILIGDNFWMIGADYPAKSLKEKLIKVKAEETPKQAIERAYGSFLDHKRKLYVIGSTVPVPQERNRRIRIGDDIWTEILYDGNRDNTVQPLFHIDMFISLIGREAPSDKFKVLVGDPRLAAEILGMDQPWGHAMVDVFDNIAKQLKEQNFQVIRNPLPLAYHDNIGRKVRQWYFATSNNVLVQNNPKVVWIPTYGHEPWVHFYQTDEANKTIWQELGYEVRQLSDFHPFAMNLGAAHCIKKYIARSDPHSF